MKCIASIISILIVFLELFSQGSIIGEPINHRLYNVSQGDSVLYAEWWEVDSLLEGEMIYYYPDKTIKSVYRYSRGVKHGPWIMYFERSGHVCQYGHNSNGIPDSIFTSYYPGLIVKSEGFFSGDYLRIEIDSTFDTFKIFDSRDETITKTELDWNELETIKLRSLQNDCFGRNYTGIGFPIIVPLKDGEWKYYNLEGKLLKVEDWLDGELIRITGY